MPESENGSTRIVTKRRRTRRHRRNRLIRTWVVCGAFGILVIGASSLAKYLISSVLHARDQHPQIEIRPERQNAANQILAHGQPSRPVYPYSVVPGGVEDVKELKWVAEHDPIVAAHYAGFDYARAQVVRLTLDRTVFVSYRIGNHIYWMRRRIKLHKGEKLITDGKITARARCANRVEEKPQVEASPNEPTPEKMEQPVRAGEGTAMQSPPVAFESALLNRPPAPGLGPLAPLSLYDPVSGGSFVPISVPPLPNGVCGPRKKGTFGGERYSDLKKKQPNPCGSGTGAVPEPGTWILFASGLAAIYWRFRTKLSRTGLSRA